MLGLIPKFDFQASTSSNAAPADMASDFVGVLESAVVLHALHGNTDPFSLHRVLVDVRPRFVVMYDTNVQFVRMLEVSSANNTACTPVALRVTDDVIFLRFSERRDLAPSCECISSCTKVRARNSAT